MDSLITWNYLAFFVHFVSAILSYFLINKTSSTVQMSRLKFNNDKIPESKVDIPVELEDNVKVDLKFIVVLFFSVTSFAHLLYATDFFGRGWYSSEITKYGWNPFRWVEYSISAGFMIYLISIASGTKDQISAVASGLIVPSLMINGFTTERELKQNDLYKWSLNPKTMKKPEIDPQIIFSNLLPAWFLFGVNWYIILSNYYKLSTQAKNAGKPFDTSISFMVYSQLFFFSLFGIIQTYQVYRWFTSKEGIVEPTFLQYEMAYIILSAVTKLFLGVTVAFAIR
jgi:hypothetical protein